MATTVDQQLRDLMPNLSTAAPAGEIPAVDKPLGDDLTPDFGVPKKRRSRARKPPASAPVEPGPAPSVTPEPMTLSPVERQQIGKALGVGFRVIFAIVASKRGQHWQISETDEALLGATWTDALAPWLVSSSKYVPVAIAALATVGVVVPRLDVDARLAPREVEPPRNPDVPKAAEAAPDATT